MVLGKHTRFLQLLRVNEVRPIKPPIDEGSSLIAVKSKLRECLVCVFKQLFSVFKQYFTHFHVLFHPHVFLQIFSNNNFQFLNTYTKRALRLCKHFMFPINSRIVSSIEQYSRLRRTRFLRIPTDGWNSHKFIQSARVHFSRFGTPAKSGDILRSDPDKSMIFNLSKFYFKEKKKLKNKSSQWVS